MQLITVVKRSPVVFMLACVATVAMVLISEHSYRQAVDTLDSLGEMGVARTSILALEKGILDAEAAQRGYLLTGQTAELEPYQRALGEIDESIEFLDHYYADPTQDRRPFDRLRGLTQSRLAALGLAIGQRGAGAVDTARAVTLGDIGRAQMDAIRGLGTELLEHEAVNVAAARADIYRTLRAGRLGMAALSAISLLALFMVLWQTRALRRQQKEQQRLVQAERDRLETEVAERTAQLTELANHLQTAREDERNRLARNLHDELGALLTSAKLDAARIKSRLAGTAPEAQERLAHLVGTLNASIALGRSIIEDLRPSTLGNLGLVAALEILAREYGEHSGVAVHCTLSPVRLAPAAELMVFRLVQESITNISKYAAARQVWLSMAACDGQVEVSVRDDGVGFDARIKPRSAYGLLGMRFRAAAEGGTLAVVSAPGQGTLVRLAMPEAPLVTD